ncbi:sigma-70 family RNA polymerase sigma factor [Streptomyces yaanensis]|uniref:Sigma-70 family RNA polymerase sigma factor n=1 Tax=Streptomyces yaanensis TaxID=1142239 RepID=A0ABV7SAN2_9ACTN|nr:sigma-70 family RNA polymerase sigma factor [Streptomyces sp. CGMCC 4.7035]WNC02773.1 sigma-70 family RNA polymerase sigma factor [Streptomyces sp. CGMCC 4.7035]
MSVDGRDESLGDDGVETSRRVPNQGGPSRGATGGSRSGGTPEHSVPAQRGGSALPPADAGLIKRMRAGDDTAYEELYRRHAEAVRRYARTCCRDAHTADDLTAEVFARMLQAVRGGSGPEHAVRAYLLTTVRRVAAAWTKSAKREQLVDDFAVFAAQSGRTSDVSDDAASMGSFGTGVDQGADVRAMHEAEQSMAMRAFRSLPERWQAVLWHTEVEDESPSEVATLFGLDANGTRVLASRAREGLRQAYLQAHVSTTLTSDEECARYADQLGTYARRRLRTRAERGLRKHLEECVKCRLAAGQIEEVANGIPAVVPIAVIGWFGAAGYAKALGIIAGGAGAAAAGAAGAAVTASGSATGGAGAGGAGVGGASVGGGAAASEGLGAMVKAGIAAGAAAVTATAIVLAVSGNHHPAKKPEAKVQATQAVESQRPTTAPTGRNQNKQPAAQPPTADPTGGPAANPAANPATDPGTDPTAAPTAAPEPAVTPTPNDDRKASASAPAPTPSKPTPSPTSPSTPTPKPKPTPTPTPTSKPTPTPPAPAVYQWNELSYDITGDGTKPEMRFGESSWLWQRWGVSIADQHYTHGVTVHGSSSVTIDLNRQCSAFDALVGVDDLTNGYGKVRFSVFVDGARLWRSPQIKGGHRAVPVHVGLAGHKTVRFVVEPHKGVDSAALADWAESRFTCR